MKLTIPRLLLAGTNSGCGKTTVTCALLQALADRHTAVCAYKCGPDYIDPMFHSTILGTQCRNLDLQFLPEDTLRWLMAQSSADFSLAVIEGVMGFYDGVGMTPKASSYEVGKALAAPVVLVVNAKGAAHSILAAISGYADLYPDSGVRGVILNQCSAMLYPMVKAAIETHFGGRIRPLGFLPPMPGVTLESRHLGLVTAAEVEDLREKLWLLSCQAEKTIDIPGLLALAGEAPALPVTQPPLPERGEPVRVAVAKDRAFCFYYEDNLQLLSRLGAELVPFSPMEDACLPENIQGLYLGGGYPELYTDQLESNASMRQSIREAVTGGLPTIAECGGFLYLQQKLLGRQMAGVFAGEGWQTERLVRFGYVNLTAQQDTLLCPAGQTIPAHEFHYFDVTDPGTAFLAKKPTGRSWQCGIAGSTLYAGFPHFHFYAHPAMADRFLAACRKEKHSND